ncbi:nucleotidyltransferase [Marinilactibacillus kalidii]|uniref:nucleotidyltransferase n=1 Tax=Marinilactibacillus kalidii TaxID=2820274 RepID=UPI001ABECC30|nr:nucleotidyltransferase [Marinilactibacillus kalidii]
MRACGIVAEYNPFHNGHLYQIKEAIKRTKSEVIIVVMSGNFLQRGEPAMVDKWSRAEMALNNGADIVLELPTAYSVQPADIFAKGAIEILSAMKCTALSFGSESGNGADFEKAAAHLVENEREIDKLFKLQNEKNLSYALRMQHVMDEFLPELTIDLSLPNNQLGLAYAKENVRRGSPFTLEVVRRKQADYHEKALQTVGNVSSATAIRHELLSGDQGLSAISDFLPEASMELLQNKPLQSWENYWKFLKYQILTATKEELKLIYQMEEGLENLLINKVEKADSFEAFMQLIKHKRMTRTRLQRLCVYVLLQIKKTDIKLDSELKATRILGFTTLGQTYLNEVKKDRTIDLLTKIDRKSSECWQLDIKAGNLYQMGNDLLTERQDFGRNPIKSIDIDRCH